MEAGVGMSQTNSLPFGSPEQVGSLKTKFRGPKFWRRGESQALYACPERSRGEPPIKAAFLARLQRFSWFSRIRADESDS